jgi:SNF family Na+-dependent transporter
MMNELQNLNARQFTVYFCVMLCAGITCAIALVTVCTSLAPTEPAVIYSAE